MKEFPVGLATVFGEKKMRIKNEGYSLPDCKKIPEMKNFPS